jgi:hypothetical protein
MEEALRFFRAFEVWIYLLLGLGGLIYLRRFILAWQELREAGFGLERENAQTRLNQAASILVVLIFMAAAVFVMVTYVAPAMPAESALPTPTLNLLASATTTLPVVPSPTAGISGENPTPVGETAAGEGCTAGQILIASPGNGQEVGNIVEVFGTADVPNFGFYKLEMKRPDETTWVTLQAGNTAVASGKLGDWDVRRLTPGDYQLGLVVVDNQAQSSPPCIVQVRVIFVPEETTSP